MGELFAGRIGMETGERSCTHWLDLSDLHLAPARAHLLTRWTPASEICPQNDLTEFRYAKDYDAVVAVESEGREMRFGLEYERTPKRPARTAGSQRNWRRRRSSTLFCTWYPTTTFCV